MKNKRFNKITIAFIIFVLFFMFFSKTLYNLSLPNISVIEPMEGTIKNVIEAKEKINISDTQKIYSNISGKILNVYVKEGESIKKGDLIVDIEIDKEQIYTLVADIAKRTNDIELLQLKYEYLNNNTDVDIDDENNKIEKKKTKITTLKTEINDLKNKNQNIKEKKELETTIEIKEFENKLYSIEETIQKNKQLYEIGALSKSDLDKSIKEKEDIQLSYDKFIEQEIKEKVDKNDNDIDSKTREIEALEQDIELLEETINTVKKEAVKNQKSNITNIAELDNQIENSKIELDLLKKQLENRNKNSIISENDGVILSVKFEKNKYVSKNDLLFEMSDKSNNYKVEFNIAKEKTKLISVGDEADISVEGIEENIKGKVKSIELSDIEDEYKVKIDINYNESFINEKQASIKITKESEKYSTIVPNSAIRQEKDGYYVLSLRETDGVLGKEFYAQKIKIHVNDSDEQNSAITGLTYIEPIITSSEKSISNGSRVKYIEGE